MVTHVKENDNAHSLRTAYHNLSARPRADGRGTIYVFSAAQTGCGTSYVARSMALIAAQINIQGANMQAQNMQDVNMKGHNILLVDMDIQNSAQSAYFFAPQAQAIHETPAGPYDATFNEVPFWRITPSMVDEIGRNLTDTHFMSLYQLSNISLSFTHFHWDKFRQGQNAHLQNARAYWHKLRDHFSAIFVDTPALDRSDILGTISTEADYNVLVSSHTEARSQALNTAVDHINSLGAHCAGVIVNEAPTQPSHYGQWS